MVGARNPYCVVLVEREKVGETPVAAKTLAPVSSPHALNLSQRFVVRGCPVSVKASSTTSWRLSSTIYIGLCMPKSEGSACKKGPILVCVSVMRKEKVRQWWRDVMWLTGVVCEGVLALPRSGKGYVARGLPLLDARYEIRNVVHHAVSFCTFLFLCHVILVQVWNHSVAIPHESVRKAADTNVWPMPYQPLTIQASGLIREGMSRY